MLNSWLKLSVVIGVASQLVCDVHAIRITSDPIEVANRTFTYVIVGGGTAGLTVASRLAEDSTVSVLVIEAGPNAQNDTIINDPGQALVAPSMYNWQYQTTAQQIGGNVIPMTQGKVLGGSSSINGMCWTRGTIDQYDSIEKLGNPGWNYKSLFQYMKAAELYTLPNPQQVALGATVNPKVHGYQGKVNAGFPQPYEGTVFANKVTESVLRAVPGIGRNIDVASGTPNGVARFQHSIKPGNKTEVSSDGNKRSSSANAHIYPFLRKKPNLVILTGYQATRLVWGTRAGNLSEAIGVQFIAAPSPNGPVGVEFGVNLIKEAIVAAGAIGSPRFLELSGVGDAKILEPLGIRVEVDLPAIGTNLQDQALDAVIYGVAADVPTSDYSFINAPFAPVVAFIDIEQMLGASGAKAASEELIQSIPARAQEIVSSGAFTSVVGMQKMLTAQAESIVDFKAPVIELSFLAAPGMIGVSLWNLIPQWRGTVHITSSDPGVLPEINPRYFTGGSNLDLFLNGNASQIAREIFNTDPLKELVTVELAPGLAAIPQNASDAQWQGFVKSGYQAVLHPIGSVPLLPRKDGGAVGPDLLVYGTSNVRVVDSSVLPVQISAHLSSTVYGIAEKAADMIKNREVAGR